MNQKWLSIVLMIAGLLLLSCSEKSEDPVEPALFLQVLPNLRTVANSADSTYFDISASSDWSAVSDADWLSIYPSTGSGDARITAVYASLGGEAREGTITVSAPGHRPESVAVTVSQSSDPPLIVSPDSRTVPHNSLSSGFNVHASGPWTASRSGEWFAIAPVSGTGDGVITLNYGSNDGNDRSGYVIVSAPGHHPTSVTVSITQEDEPKVLNVSPLTRIVPYDGTAIPFNVIAEGPWSVTWNATWLDCRPASSDGGDTYFRALFEPNTGYERRAEIKITAPDHHPESVIVTLIHQASPTSPPGPPANLEISDVYWDQMSLDWEDRSSNEVGFIVQRKEGVDGFWGEAGRVAENVTSFIDLELDPLILYTYRVLSYNGYGVSDPGNEFSSRTHTEIIDYYIDGIDHEGNIEVRSDKDWYGFNIAQSGLYAFTVTLSSLYDSQMWLYGPDSRTFERAYDDDSGEGAGSMFALNLPAGRYYLKVAAKDEAATGNYLVRAEVVE